MDDPLSAAVARCQAGDAAAFAVLVTETQSGVYGLAYNVLRDAQEAQDMTQEVYLRVWQALPRFRGEARFTTWLYRIAVNTCLNRRRRLRLELRVVDDATLLERLPEPGADPQRTVLDDEARARLRAAVDALPDKYRLVVTLFYGQELSYVEIAELLSLPLGTVKAHLNRARLALAERYRPAGQEVDHVPV
jgi:RNA polymerase sigma-70 factor (ECF subfamily)